MRKGGGNGKGKREWNMFFTPRRLRGGVRAQSGRGGWRVGDDVWRFATPQKFAGANFYPPPQAAEGGISCREIPAFAGMEERSGNGKRGGNGKRDGNGKSVSGRAIKKHSHSRESGNLPESLTVFWHRALKQLEVREIPAFAGMEKGRAGMKWGGGNKKSVSGRRRGWLGRNPAGRAFWRGGIGWRNRRRRGRGRGGLL